jgi:DNA modification methylase
MNSHFDDTNSLSWDLPESFQDDDVRLSEDVIERYVARFTKPGDRVLDPFAGFGTTLVVAERMGRSGIGYELLPERAEYANSLLSSSEVKVGDIRNADLAGMTFSMIISSPPYMNRTDPEDPLQAYKAPVASYERYIEELAAIYVVLSDVLTLEGRLVIQLQNLRNDQGVTPLVFDLVGAIGQRLEFLGEEAIIWQESSYGYSHGFCLIYKHA